jgi:hypothetical protein
LNIFFSNLNNFKKLLRFEKKCSYLKFVQIRNLFISQICSNFRKEKKIGKKGKEKIEKKHHLSRPNRNVPRAERTKGAPAGGDYEPPREPRGPPRRQRPAQQAAQLGDAYLPSELPGVRAGGPGGVIPSLRPLWWISTLRTRFRSFGPAR